MDKHGYGTGLWFDPFFVRIRSRREEEKDASDGGRNAGRGTAAARSATSGRRRRRTARRGHRPRRNVASSIAIPRPMPSYRVAEAARALGSWPVEHPVRDPGAMPDVRRRVSQRAREPLVSAASTPRRARSRRVLDRERRAPEPRSRSPRVSRRMRARAKGRLRRAPPGTARADESPGVAVADGV